MWAKWDAGVLCLWVTRAEQRCSVVTVWQLHFRWWSVRCVRLVLQILLKLWLHFLFKMNQIRIEQRQNIKFCVQSGVSHADTVTRLQNVYQNNALSAVSIWRWGNHFNSGEVCVKDAPHSGRPHTGNNNTTRAQLCGFLQEDHWQTVRQLARRSQLAISTVHHTFKIMKFTKKSATWIHHDPTNDN